MAIRIRIVNNKTIALCAAKTEQHADDIYLDDVQHHALTRKFEADFKRMGFWKFRGIESIVKESISHRENSNINR